MIQNINPHKFDLTYGQPKAQDEDFVLYIKKSKTLLRKVDEENHEIPKFSDFPEDKELLKESAYYLFAIDGNHYYYVTKMPRYDADVYELCSTERCIRCIRLSRESRRHRFIALKRAESTADAVVI